MINRTPIEIPIDVVEYVLLPEYRGPTFYQYTPIYRWPRHIVEIVPWLRLASCASGPFEHHVLMEHIIHVRLRPGLHILTCAQREFSYLKGTGSFGNPIRTPVRGYRPNARILTTSHIEK